MDKPARNSQRIKRKALELDFLDCGIAPAEFLEKDAGRLKSWLEMGHHGEMGYMEDHFEKRTDPGKLVEGARSVIVVLQNYHTTGKQLDPAAPKVSKYAYGRDHHKLIRRKLDLLLKWMQEEMGQVSGRAFVDSAPVMEKALAARGGLGWVGKHSLLLSRRYGSWFFLGVLICDLELEPDSPVKEYCGDCTRCVDACPTNAILPGRIVNATRCISYLTVERKGGPIPPGFKNRMDNRAFGCDICQDVCPWNSNARPHDEEWLKPRPGLLEMTLEEWMDLDEQKFNEIFEGSAVKRTGYKGLRRNLDFLSRPS